MPSQLISLSTSTRVSAQAFRVRTSRRTGRRRAPAPRPLSRGAQWLLFQCTRSTPRNNGAGRLFLNCSIFSSWRAHLDGRFSCCYGAFASPTVHKSVSLNSYRQAISRLLKNRLRGGTTGSPRRVRPVAADEHTSAVAKHDKSPRIPFDAGSID